MSKTDANQKMGVNVGVPEAFNDNDIVMSRFIL